VSKKHNEHKEDVKPVNDELAPLVPSFEAETPLDGAVVAEVVMTDELKEAVLVAFNNESSIQFLKESVNDNDAVVITGVHIPKHQVVALLEERAALNAPTVQEEAVAYFRKEQTLLPVILQTPHNFTQLKLDHLNNGEPVNLSNANLIGWFQEDEVLGPIVEEIAGLILVEQAKLAELAKEVEEPPVVVEEAPLNNQPKFGIA